LGKEGKNGFGVKEFEAEGMLVNPGGESEGSSRKTKPSAFLRKIRENVPSLKGVWDLLISRWPAPGLERTGSCGENAPEIKEEK